MPILRFNPATYTLAAMMIVAAGSVVELEAGLYSNVGLPIKADGVTIRGVPGPNGERPHFQSDGLVNLFPHMSGTWTDRGICVVKGDNAWIEGIEFSGAKSYKYNGAGIRHEAAGLVVKNCFFHDNENGILGSEHEDPATPQHDGGLVWLEGNEFARSGAGNGQSHNVYISRAETCVFIGNYSHSAKVGHLFKTRSKNSIIVNNRFADGDGNPSYHCDIDGGNALIDSNTFDKGLTPGNPGCLIFYYLWHANEPNALQIRRNRMQVTTKDDGFFVKVDNTYDDRAGAGIAGTVGKIDVTIADNVAIYSNALNAKGTGPSQLTYGVHPWKVPAGAVLTNNAVVPLGKEPVGLPVMVQHNLTPDTLAAFIAANMPTTPINEDDLMYKEQAEALAVQVTQLGADLDAANAKAAQAQAEVDAANSAKSAAEDENAVLKAKLAQIAQLAA